jgi:hypothetical protein
VAPLARASLLIALALSFYLSAAIASLHDGYQSGIEAVIFVSHPRMLLFGLVVLCLVAIERRRTREWAPFAERAVPWVFAGCVAAAFAIFSIESLGWECTIPGTHGRGLWPTLRYSLTCPSFSPRSYHVAFQTAMFCPAVFVFARHLALGQAQPGPASPLQQLAAAGVAVSLLAAAPGLGYIGWRFSIFLATGKALGLRPHLVPFAGLAVAVASQLLLCPLALLTERFRWRLWLAPLVAGLATLLAIGLPVSHTRFRLWGFVYGTLCGIWLALAMTVQLFTLRLRARGADSGVAQDLTGQRPLRVE